MKYMGLFGVILLACGCCTPQEKLERTAINGTPKSYTEALKELNTSCQTDADCAVISTGCCPCNDKVAVNKDFAAQVRPLWLAQCERVACTMQMCYNDISASCQSGVCVGSPKKYEDYFVK